MLCYCIQQVQQNSDLRAVKHVRQHIHFTWNFWSLYINSSECYLWKIPAIHNISIFCRWVGMHSLRLVQTESNITGALVVTEEISKSIAA